MKIYQLFYISTGRKNAMYTLRFQRGPFIDCYVCNLSTNEEKAAEKATAYVDAFRERVGESDSFSIVLDDSAGGIFERRGKLSAYDTAKIEAIENGLFPFGKHAGTEIAKAPDSYILFFADKAKEEQKDAVSYALTAACLGVALERGLIAKREAARAERKEQDSRSNYVGSIKERRQFEGVVIGCFEKEGQTGYYYINKIRCGEDIICYVGNKLANKGESVSFKATIVAHDEYQGVKSTKVNRPANVLVTVAAEQPQQQPVEAPQATNAPAVEPTRTERLKALEEAANYAYRAYDKEERRGVANEAYCAQLYAEYQTAYKAWQDAKNAPEEDNKPWRVYNLAITHRSPERFATRAEALSYCERTAEDPANPFLRVDEEMMFIDYRGKVYL